MRTILCCVSVLFALILAAAASPPSAAVFFADDFDGYADDVAAGWSMIKTGGTETANWTVANPAYGGLDTRLGPATQRGTRSAGKFMMSDSDAASGENAVNTGHSFDLYSRSQP
jgi:hypothetical protein